MTPITTLRIAAANVSQKPLRSLSLALIVAVFTFMLFSGSMIAANLQAGIESLSARMGADLLVVPQGEGRKVAYYHRIDMRYGLRIRRQRKAEQPGDGFYSLPG